ncbi:MAG: polysaccharide deacetylase family protein [Candidatus Dormibacteria bacterium]
MRRGAFGFGLGCLTFLAVSGCSSPPAPAPTPTPTPTLPTPVVTPIRVVIAPPQVVALANAFEHQFVARDYGLQWSELAPQAQAIWPSESARATMLTRKFADAAVASISVGAPTLESMWTAPENPSVQVANVWSLPVALDFADPAALRPAGVAALFAMTSLQIVLDPASGTAEILGEGPESLDAPIIVPASIPAVSLDVPILMYHLVDQVPPRSIEPSTYGWKLEIGLTTLPGAFDAQMAYLVSIHATSISLQHLADALLYGLQLPPHPFVITFDDGRLSPWTNAVPVLRRDGFTAVFFPCTALIGGKVGPQTYMTASEIKNLAATGFSIEDHTVNDGTDFFSAGAHTLDLLTNRTKAVLQTLTGDPIQFIAYTGLWPWPMSTQGTTREASMFATLANYGYVGGVQDLRVDSATETSTALWQLPRVRVGLTTGIGFLEHWFGAQPS